MLEAPILRWLYVRRQPKQTFDIDFGPEVVRLYDEWDALARKAADPEKRDAQVLACERASSTATAGPLPTPRVVVPFRLLSSVADVTAGSAEQISRIVGDVGTRTTRSTTSSRGCRKAMAWTERVRARPTAPPCARRPTRRRLAALSSEERSGCACCSTGCPTTLDLDAVTSLVYGVPKLARGLALDDKPTDEVKADQKEFFGLLYRLLVDAERGPRLPDADRGAGRRPGAVGCWARAPSAERASPAARRRPRGWSRAGTSSSAPTPRPRRSRGRTGRAGPGSAGSRGWARAPTAPGRGPSSRCGAAGRGCGGSRPGRRRRR